MEEVSRHLRYEFLWWGIIRQGTDFLVFLWLICGPLLGMVLFAITLTASFPKKILVALILGGLVSWVSAVGLFCHRSRAKRVDHERNGRLPLPQNGCGYGGGSHSHATVARTFAHFARHTAMEMSIIIYSVIVLGFVEASYQSLRYNRKDDDIVRPVEFWMVYLQIVVSTVIFFRYYHDVQATARRIRQNFIVPLSDVVLVASHLSSAILLLEGWSVLIHFAWQNNPWATPLYALEGLAAMGVMIRWSSRLPTDGETDP